MSYFDSLEAFDAFLEGLGLFHMDLSLARIERCLDALELRRPPYLAAQVVGTNGKGSTAALLAGLAAAHGLRAGLYTSPHFRTPRERIRIIGPEETPEREGPCLSVAAWLAAANAVHNAQEAAPLTYFEFLTAMAAVAFRDASVDFAVFEAGLGGRHDATTALRAPYVGFTRMGLDHVNVLGETLAEIAADKADAMLEGGTAVTIRQEEAARFALDKAALLRRCRLLEARPPDQFEDAFAALPGFLRENGRLAMALWLLVATEHDHPVDPAAITRVLGRTVIPGRMQHVCDADGRWLLLDGAHNPQALGALATAMDERGLAPTAVIFTCLADKDLSAMATALAKSLPAGALVLAPELPDVARARPAGEIVAALRRVALDAHRLNDVAAAVQAAPDTPAAEAPLLVCGSLYLLSAFFTLKPHLLGPLACDEP